MARAQGGSEMSFAVVRMQKMKSHDLKGMQFHNQRERESRTNPDIDKERSHENYDLANEKKIDYNERVKQIIESQKTGTRKTRKDAVLVNELVITSDRDFFDRLEPAEQKRFFEESYQLFSERYGKQNVAYAMVHNDEKTPHLHMGVVPMRDGRLQGKNVFNRQELLWIQEEFPKHMQGLGFDLERGEKGSAREHIETAKFKKQTLEKEIDFLEKGLVEKKKELLDMSENVPPELKIKAKKERKTVIEDKLIHFGKPKTVEKETGNLVISYDEYKKMREIVSAAVTIKNDYERLQSTDLVKENKELRSHLKEEEKDYSRLTGEYMNLSRKTKKLEAENVKLERQNSDLRQEIKTIYQSAKEFLKERTSDSRAFKNVFKGFIDKVKEKMTGSEIARLYNREQARDRGMDR